MTSIGIHFFLDLFNFIVLSEVIPYGVHDFIHFIRNDMSN